MTKLTIYGQTDVGKERDHNEDTFLIGATIKNKEGAYLELSTESSLIKDDGLLVAVADGMGGHKAGEMASGLALNLLLRQFISSPKGDLSKEEIKMALNESIVSVHKVILNMSISHHSYSGMGTTIVGMYFIRDGCYAFHCGDSRLYRLRNGVLRQLTKDHSLVQSLIDLGQITKEESYYHPQKGIITNCLGGGYDECQPEVTDSYTVFEGDTFLLCSDGLSDIVAEGVIEKIINSEKRIQEKMDALINTANNNGGRDNITAVLIEVE